MNSKTPSVGLSHQASFLSEKCPRPKTKSLFSESILKYFAPVNRAIGFHFKRYDSFILPPVIRREIRDLSPTQKNHITVYLPSFDHETLASIFLQCKNTEWHLFSPLCDEEYQKENVWVRPVGNKPFLESIESSKGVLAGAGFETCAEAMYLGKKLLAVPIKNQYEQYCNAAALSEMGVITVNQIGPSFTNTVQNWIDDAPIVQLEEAAEIDELAELLFRFTSIRQASRDKASVL
ncbi:glycosyltransferase family protein [Rhodohalobacter sp.]|uniref:glycosyltransferase family protein n=1 Tax=Rhodohalobacter sp. TaxID=1974210 RepID=UPI002ACE3846|nr:glycosyltransferase family protein [Rhodohalobacter sp.]MDZ7755441.1 glycosyltransferase family protein [Rhodohalobacter sp.]